MTTKQTVQEWIDSPKGQKSLNETAECVRKMNEAKEKLDHKLLSEPVTI